MKYLFDLVFNFIDIPYLLRVWYILDVYYFAC